MTSKTSEKELLNRLSRLPREMEPVHDPWEKISGRLHEPVRVGKSGSMERRRPAWPLMAVAASAVLALTVVLLPGKPEPVSGPGQPVVSSASGPPSSPDSMPLVRAGSEAEYLAAFREFATVGDSRDRIPAQTVEQIETGWAELQQVETALEDALALNPEDPFLNKRMLDLRAKQLGFLRQLAALDHSNRRLTI